HAAADAGDDESEAASTESLPAEASTTQDQPPSSASASGQQSVDENESAAENESSAEDESAAEDEPSGDSETTAAADPVDPAAEDSWVVDDIEGESSPTTRTETSSSDAVPSGLESGSTADSASAEAGDSTSQRERSAATAMAEASTTESEPSATDPDASESHEQRADIDEQRAAPSTTPTNPTAPTTQRTLDGEPTTGSRQYESLPDLRVLGQLYDTYLLAEADDGLLLIDQHAADERVNYERLQRALGESPTTQQLAEPVSLELTAREAALFERATDELGEIGFAAEQRDGREIAVTAVPAVFETTLDPTLLRDALLGFVESAEDADTVAAAVDDLLADLACYPSVTGNTSLTEGSVVDLLETLDDCENPYACPHGRPVVIEISREEIGERFERDYPGHSGRREE
ncbi:MAG: DNA mismatch repair protein MutL, partial [Halonotius sp.]